MEKKALTRMQQELANQATTTRQQHQETLQQTLTTAQHTHELVQQLRTAQAGPVDIQGTFCSERRRSATNHENDVDIIKHHIRRQKPQ